MFTGVFATFSGLVPRLTLLWAAVRYAGADAVLSHESAAELTGLLDRPAARVHVTIPATRRIRPAPNLVVHRSRRVAEARHPSRLPAQTRIEETVIDLAQGCRQLDPALSWLATACGRRLTTAGRLAETVRHRRRVRWRRELLAALDDVADGCHSLLELRYLRDVERQHRLPAGQRQATRPRGGGRWYDDVRYPPVRPAGDPRPALRNRAAGRVGAAPPRLDGAAGAVPVRLPGGGCDIDNTHCTA